MKILKDLGNNRYEVEIIPYDEERGIAEKTVGVAHDYVSFCGRSYLSNSDGSCSQVSEIVDIHIPIRMFIKSVLPFLNSHKYCQLEHIKDREHEKDDIRTPQKYRKGDKYPAYAYYSSSVRIWSQCDDTNHYYVYIEGEGEPTIMTSGMYKIFKKGLNADREDKLRQTKQNS